MKKVLALLLAFILILGILLGTTSDGTSTRFSDTETSSGNTFTASEDWEE
jgi:predicted ribosomally synthesized peptide with SipW-like signal peptide